MNNLFKQIAKIQKAKTPLYYVIDDRVQPGTIVHAQQQQFTPEFFACHPTDLEKLKADITSRELIPLSEWGRMNG